MGYAVEEVMIFIIAGDGHQADYWAKKFNLKKSECRYVYNGNMCRGLRNIKYIKVGTWWKHININEILAILANSKAEEINLKENQLQKQKEDE